MPKRIWSRSPRCTKWSLLSPLALQNLRALFASFRSATRGSGRAAWPLQSPLPLQLPVVSVQERTGQGVVVMLQAQALVRARPSRGLQWVVSAGVVT